MTALSSFARLLGLPVHQAEDALYSERAARAVLSRRAFGAAVGALVCGTAFSFATPKVKLLWNAFDFSWILAPSQTMAELLEKDTAHFATGTLAWAEDTKGIYMLSSERQWLPVVSAPK